MPARPNRRTAFWLTLMLAAAAVATAAALLQWVGLHRASKPLVMLFAIIFVAGRADLAGADGRFRWLLMAALACSMAGDALLIVSPEHARVFIDAGWSKARLLQELVDLLQLPDGSMLVSDDKAGAIYRISYSAS